MKFNKILLLISLLLLSFSCSDHENEKHIRTFENIVSIKDKVLAFNTGDIIIGNTVKLLVVDKFLVICDPFSFEEQIHLFDKHNFTHIVSTGFKGLGPDEITVMGSMVYDSLHRKLYVSDHGKQKVLSYDIDSLIINGNYSPKVKLSLIGKQFPAKYYYVNDSVCFARIIEPTGNSGYNESFGKWNMLTGDIELLPYKHPEIEKRRITFTVSPKDSIYIECYSYHDLMTICNLKSELICNIYGPNWDNKTSNKTKYYRNVVVCKDKIIASYCAKKNFRRGNQPSKLIVFSMNGDYIKTLDVGYMFRDFCYDEESNRLIFAFDDREIEFGTVLLDGILE